MEDFSTNSDGRTSPGRSVTIDDVRMARRRISAILPPTALIEWPALGSLLGCRYFAKHENHQPIGAFKVRGGVNLVGLLSDAQHKAGILGCSTGNHGPSLAFAGRLGHVGTEGSPVHPGIGTLFLKSWANAVFVFFPTEAGHDRLEGNAFVAL